MTETKTVTFQTRLDPARETPKAFKIDGGSYLAKSLVSIEFVKDIECPTHYGQKPGPKQIVMVTMPEWLSKKL